MSLLSAVSCRFQRNRAQLVSYGIHSISSSIAKRRLRTVTVTCLDTQRREGARPWVASPWRSWRLFTTSDDDDQVETIATESFNAKGYGHKQRDHEIGQQLRASDAPTENGAYIVLDDHLPSDNDSDCESEENGDGLTDDDAVESQMVAKDIFNVTKTSPLAALNLHYSNEYGRSSVRDCFVVEQRELLWFATFVCPETGIEYPHGTLRSFEQEPQELGIATTTTATCTTHSSTTIDGQVGYRKKNSAIHGAAARVLDIIHYTKLLVSEPRLCDEDPAAFYREFVAPKASPKSIHTLEPVVAPARNIMRHVDDSDTAKFMETFTVDPGEAAVTDENYIIAEVPSPSCEHEPSQRLLHAFSSRQLRAQPSTATDNDLNSQQRMPSSMGPLARLELAINLAKSWAQANTPPESSEMDDHLHRIHLPISPSMRTKVVGRTLLENLAEANQMVAISPDFMGCEEVAWQLLDIICKHTNSCTDADAYNLLLKCLEGKNPLRIAQKAEAIVNAMRSGKLYKGRTLPRPNINTVNILIQLWAQVGGTTGRYDNFSSDFVPNRESFLSLLSSCCYLPQVRGEKGGLDIEFAKDCILRMQELSKTHPDDVSLVPDIHVYNAPLRWRGGLFARASRPYARPIPWDSFDKSGKDELRAFDIQDSRVIWAQDIESWIDYMQQQGIRPDIESFEALMQAWLATGTRVGLERAQTIADNLLKGIYEGAAPRLQTFRPLILKWLFSKSANSEQVIESLINKLDLISESNPELRPDARLRMALVQAYRNQALTEIEPLSIETQVRRAEKSSSILNQLRVQLLSDIEDGEATEVFLETIYFVLTMDIWQILAKSCVKNQLISDSCKLSYERAIKEMNLLMEYYDELIQSLMKEESPDGIGLRLRREYSIQLKHLVGQSGALYSSYILALRDLCQCHKEFEVGDGKVKGDLYIENLFAMERIVRRSGEMKLAYTHETDIRLERHDSSDSSFIKDGTLQTRAHDTVASGPIQYDDFFTTVRLRRRNLDATERSVLLCQILECLSVIDLSSVNLGDYTRLLLLIKESIEDKPGGLGSVSTTKPGALVDRLLERVIRTTNIDSAFPLGSKYKTEKVAQKARRRMAGRYKRNRRTSASG